MFLKTDGRWKTDDGSSVCNPKYCRIRMSPHPSAVKSGHPSCPRDFHKLQTDGTMEDGWFLKKVCKPKRRTRENIDNKHSFSTRLYQEIACESFEVSFSDSLKLANG
jgi:hypothetical protein